MHILWEYLKPYRWLAALSLLLARISQVLALVDPIIFGKIIDDYATQTDSRSDAELVTGVLSLLAIALSFVANLSFWRAIAAILWFLERE